MSIKIYVGDGDVFQGTSIVWDLEGTVHCTVLHVLKEYDHEAAEAWVKSKSSLDLWLLSGKKVSLETFMRSIGRPVPKPTKRIRPVQLKLSF